MAVADQIRDKLTAAFQPTALEVIDDSAKHAGHRGARPQGETHYTVRITSAAFAGRRPRARAQRARAGRGRCGRESGPGLIGRQ